MATVYIIVYTVRVYNILDDELDTKESDLLECHNDKSLSFNDKWLLEWVQLDNLGHSKLTWPANKGAFSIQPFIGASVLLCDPPFEAPVRTYHTCSIQINSMIFSRQKVAKLLLSASIYYNLATSTTTGRSEVFICSMCYFIRFFSSSTSYDGQRNIRSAVNLISSRSVADAFKLNGRILTSTRLISRIVAILLQDLDARSSN